MSEVNLDIDPSSNVPLLQRFAGRQSQPAIITPLLYGVCQAAVGNCDGLIVLVAVCACRALGVSWRDCGFMMRTKTVSEVEPLLHAQA